MDGKKILRILKDAKYKGTEDEKNEIIDRILSDEKTLAEEKVKAIRLVGDFEYKDGKEIVRRIAFAENSFAVDNILVSLRKRG